MAASECTQLVKTEIPSLDEDLSQYIESKFSKNIKIRPKF